MKIQCCSISQLYEPRPHFIKLCYWYWLKKNLNQDDKEIIRKIIDSSKQKNKETNTEILSNIYSEEIERCFKLFMDNV